MTSDGSKIAAVSDTGRIYVSTDGGKDWQSTNTPEQNHWPVLAGSTSGDHLIAAFYQGGVYTSTGWGTNWVQSTAKVDAWKCLACSADGTSMVAGASPGLLYASKDSGITWTQLGAPRGFWQGIASSADGSRLLAATDGGSVYRSIDGGTNWSKLSITTNAIAFFTDTLALAGVDTEYVPTNKTTYFNEYFPTAAYSLLISSNLLTVSDAIGLRAAGVAIIGSTTKSTSKGTNTVNIMATNVINGYLLGLNIQGSNVVGGMTGTNILGRGAVGTNAVLLPFNCSNLVTGSLAVPVGPIGTDDTNGTFLSTNFINVIDTNVFHSANADVAVVVSNVLNVRISCSANQPWSAVASSADGSHLAATVKGGFIYASTDSGATWGATSAPGANWLAIAMSSDGRTLLALSQSGLLYDSSDFGVSWAGTNVPATTGNFGSVACSADGSQWVAALSGGSIYSGHTIPMLVPSLKISAAAGNVILSWPANSPACTLQQNTGVLEKTAWTDLSATPVVTNGENCVILPMPAGQCSYRLKQP